MTRARRPAAAAAGFAGLALAALAVAGCSSSGAPAAAHSSSVAASSSFPAASAPAPSLSAAPSTPDASSSAAPSAAPSTSAATSAAAPASITVSVPAPAVYHSTCTDVTVLVLPGGSEPHTQIAGLQFTNQSHSSCTLTGFAGVQLLHGSNPVGSPATASGTVHSMVLAPGAVAESKLQDDVSNCQGAQADGAKIRIPGRTETEVTDLAVPLRACSLQVLPLGPPD